MENHSTRKPLMGLCPIGKFVFSHEDALRQKRLLQEKLRQWDVRFVDLDDVLEDGMVRNQSHVENAVEHFRQTDVDCLFVPHCNFGTEGAVGMIARALNVPTLLWGPRDEAPLADGTRLRDTLCGLFASSKLLHKFDIPFSYIENCSVEDPPLAQGVDRFMRAVSVANVFRRGVKIGCIGQRIDFFWTTIINENELLTRFNIELLPLDLGQFIAEAKERVRTAPSLYADEAARWRKKCQVEDLSDEAFMNVLAVRDELFSVAEKQGLDGIALKSFMEIVDAMGGYCTFAASQVAERVALGLESDVHGVISDLLLRRADFDQSPVHVAEFVIRHPGNDNGALLWHSNAPLSMRHPESDMRIGHHWILPSPLSGMVHFRMKDGPITVCRFDGEDGQYQLAFGECRTMDGPPTQNTYAWVEVDNWPRWERTLIEGPFIHHMGMCYGHYAEVLKEACRFIPGLQPTPLDP